MSYNANDRKQIREAKKASRLDDRARQATISSLMSTNLGRQYVYNLLSRCHVFSSSFNTNALAMAFAEGERNVGLAIVADIMPICADQYTIMTREAHDRSIAADARTSAGLSLRPKVPLRSTKPSPSPKASRPTNP